MGFADTFILILLPLSCIVKLILLYFDLKNIYGGKNDWKQN